MSLIHGNQQYQPPMSGQSPTPLQQENTIARIKSRAVWLAKRIFGFWLVIMLPFKLLSNFMIYNNAFQMNEILSSIGFIMTIYVFSVVVAVVGSFVIKD